MTVNSIACDKDSRKNTDLKQILRVLVISYYYPPWNVIGSVRLGKITKYLSEYDCEPWVLTLETGLFPNAAGLAVEIPDSRIIRANLGSCFTRLVRQRLQNISPTLPIVSDNGSIRQRLSSLVMLVLQGLWRYASAQFSDTRFPDRALPWVQPAIKKGTALLKEHRFDAIVSSHGPPSSHIVAAALAKKFNLPWIADYRDLWTQNHFQKRHSLAQWLETRLEKRLLRRASHLTTVSEPLSQQLRELHRTPVTVLHNGFDAADFLLNDVLKTSDKFMIVYTGMIYPGKLDPTPLFAAIRLLYAKWPEVAKHVEIHFLGTDPSLVAHIAAKSQINDQVFIHPRLPNREAIRWQQTADMLLLLVWDDPVAKGIYTGKVFEYLGARRPILATGPSGGVIEALLRETKSGELVNSAEQAAQMILAWWQVKQRTGSTRLPEQADILRPYTRYYQAGILAGVLRVAVENHRHRP